ncbi:map kinase [Moniliophthora roreri]|nr:map kinase [Moniliophthora roreri]
MSFVKLSIFGTSFEVTTRYVDLQPVGMGAFGLVCSAKDQLTGSSVAIKKIMKPFSTPVLSKRTYRELKLLKHIQHENIISLSDVFISPLEDLYALHSISKLTSLTNLCKIFCHRTARDGSSQTSHLPATRKAVHPILFVSNIARVKICSFRRGRTSGPRENPVTFSLTRTVTSRRIQSFLVPYRQPNLITRPQICDFGLARIQDPQMTGYVSTRYYRAPEIMLTWQKYDVAVDIWSTGCIFAEMLEGKPLFPGKDHVNQFSIITELLGTPPDDVIETIASENTLRFVKSLPKRERVPFSQKLRTTDPDGGRSLIICCSVTNSFHRKALDLLEKMLVFDPRKRIDATESLDHEYVAPYHDPTDEPEASEKFDWSFNDADLPVDTWKVMMYSEILDFHQVGDTSTTASGVPEGALAGPEDPAQTVSSQGTEPA